MNLASMTQLCACLPLFLLAPVAESPSFQPEAGSQATKTFQTSLELSVANFAVLLAGADPGAPEMVLSGSWTRTVEVSDTYVTSRDGRPMELKRKFDSIAYELSHEMTVDESGNTGTGRASGSSELEGKEVRFEWDEEESGYEAAFVGEPGASELLEFVVEDMDLRTFLPTAQVDLEDSWEIGAEEFLSTLVPGGSLALAIELQVPGHDPRFPVVGIHPQTFLNLGDWIEGEASGDVTAKFSSVRETDGKRLAVIEIEIDVSTQADSTELWNERLGTINIDGAAITGDRVQSTLELDGKGQLLWDLGAGHLHSYSIDCAANLSLEQELSVDADGEILPVEAELELEGTFQMTVN